MGEGWRSLHVSDLTVLLLFPPAAKFFRVFGRPAMGEGRRSLRANDLTALALSLLFALELARRPAMGEGQRSLT